jgi:hypothetical protein
MTHAPVHNLEAARLLEASFVEETLIRQAQGRQVRALARFAEVGGTRRSVTEEVALYFSVSRTKADSMLEVATALVSRLPRTLAAVDAGDIDLFKAAKITRATRVVSDGVAAQVDAYLASRLVDRDPGSIRNSANYAVHKYDPEGHRARAKKKRALRHISLQHDDEAMTTLSGYLPSEVASSIYASLDRAAKARRGQDKSRTLDQHRADLFAERLLAEDGHIPDWLAQEIASDPNSTWSRLITDPATGQLLEAGSDKYRAPASLARFIKARDRECTQPGCHRPAEFSDIDHIVTRAQHGDTSHHNCHGYCRLHNQLRNEPGWHAQPTGNGTMTITTPSGHTYQAAPEPLHDPRPDPLT